MRLVRMLTIVAVLVVPMCLVAQAPTGDVRSKAIAPFIDNSTFVVVRLDLTKPDSDELAFMLPTIQGLLGVKSAIYANQFKELFRSLRKAGAKELYAVFGFIGAPYSPVFVVPTNTGVNAKSILELFGPESMYRDTKAEVKGAAVIFGRQESLQQVRNLVPNLVPFARELTRALTAAGEATCQVAIALSPDARRAFEELIPTMSKELGGGPSTLITRGLHWAALGLNGGPKKSFNLVAQASDEAAADKLQTWIPAFLKSLKSAGKDGPQDQKTKDLWNAFEAAISPPARAGSKLALNFDAVQTAILLKPFEQQNQFANDRKIVARNLKEIATAMHSYHDAKKIFPAPANYDKQGKPLLSWRVHVLQYLGQEELYRQFRLDEPWDSEHNKKLTARIPHVYRHPLGKGVAEGMTAFLVPVGKETMFPGEKGIKADEVTSGDGLSNTIMLFEVADDSMVIWTKPDDWQFNSKNPHQGLVDKSRPAFMAVFGDAATHQIKNEIPAELLQAAITRNGGGTHYLGVWEVGW